MSIAALNQTFDEVRRLAIAGSDLAHGDFRLKKLVEPLRKSAAKAPVFGKVADGIEKLLESDSRTSAESLLELTTLVTAILSTQGETGVEGELTPLPSRGADLLVSQTSARVLKPLVEALTSTGSGRLEIIEAAHQRGAFKDLRLIQPALKALDDPYGEIASFVAEHVLPLYGSAIVPELKARFDPRGRGGHARRLQLLHTLDPASTRDIVDAALESGSKEVKLAAIACLEGRTDAVDVLVEQAASRTQDVRAAALQVLAPLDHPTAIAVLKKALSGKEPELVAGSVAANPSPELQAFILERLAEEVRDLLDPPAAVAAGSKATKKKTTTGAAPSDDQAARAGRVWTLLCAVTGRTDDAAVDLLLHLLEDRRRLYAARGNREGSGEGLVRQLGHALLATGAPRALKALAALGPEALPPLLGPVVEAQSRLRSPAEVYDVFAPVYGDRPTGRSKAAEQARERASAVAVVIRDLADRRSDDDAPRLDPRWLDAAIEADDLPIVIALEQPGHVGLERYYDKRVEGFTAARDGSAHLQLDAVLLSMARTGHPRLVPALTRIFGAILALKNPGYAWGYYRLFQVIPQLPGEAIPPLEALLTNAKTEGPLLDAYAAALDELRQTRRNPADA